jgi:hypothetical protein
MVPLAPRYDDRILDAIQMLDDREEPMAEICRRIGEAAWSLGLPRPSYVHLRRLLHVYRELCDEEEARRRELREIRADVAVRLLTGRAVDAYEVADRVARAPRRRAHRLTS